MAPTYLNHVKSWQSALSGNTYHREDPSDHRNVIGEFPDASPRDVDHAADIALAAQPDWARQPAIARSRVLAATAGLLRQRSEQIGTDLAIEVGKPLAEAIGEVRRAADVFDYVAALGSHANGSIYPSSHPDAVMSTVTRPVGVVAAITPFNFPAFVASFKVAAAIMAGNALVWKPSPLTPLTGVRIVEALLDAGLPHGVIGYLTGSGAELGERLVTHPAITAVSFTGSTAVGRQVEMTAAQNGKRAQVEKGGHNPLLVFSDADLSLAADAVVSGAFGGSGQKCTSTGRVLVEASVADELTGLVVDRARRLAIGPALGPSTQIGPLVSASARDRVAAAVTRAAAEGAEVRLGGQVPGGAKLAHGCYFQPTVLTHVTPDMAVAREEVFGPVVAVMPVSTRDEAIALANATEYGLSAGIFTGSLAWCHRFIREVRAGMLHVNMPTTGVEPNAPFGGLKNSASGPPELGPDCLAFYLEQSTVTLNSGHRT